MPYCVKCGLLLADPLTSRDSDQTCPQCGTTLPVAIQLEKIDRRDEQSSQPKEKRREATAEGIVSRPRSSVLSEESAKPRRIGGCLIVLAVGLILRFLLL